MAYKHFLPIKKMLWITHILQSKNTFPSPPSFWKEDEIFTDMGKKLLEWKKTILETKNLSCINIPVSSAMQANHLKERFVSEKPTPQRNASHRAPINNQPVI